MQTWGPQLAIILGVVEGLTEYLPVSSTGHLILVGHWFGFTGDVAASAEISIQLGAILAVIVYERSKLASFLSHAAMEQGSFRVFVRERHGKDTWGAILRQSAGLHRSLWFLIGLGVAFLPAAVVGLLTHRWIETYLFTPTTVAVASIVGGLIIIAVEAWPTHARITQLDQTGVSTALWIGLAQCVSLIPGTSRSGATIIGGLLAGLDRKTATEYSFFLALPTLIAATSYKMVKARDLFSNEDYLALALGSAVAFLVAWAVIAGFLNFVKHHSLRVFAYYRIVLGMVVLSVIP